MLTKKKKISRKEIKEDKLVSTFYKAQNFYEEYKSKIILYGVIAAVAIVAVYFYLNQQAEQNEQAGLHLANVMSIYDSGAYLEAIEGRQGTDVIGLKKIVEEYGGTENGETAKIYLANAYSNLGKTDEAFNYYSDYSGDIEILKAASIAGQAAYYATKDDFEKAADLYRDAARVTQQNLNNSDYLLNAGIYYIKAGEEEQAQNLLEELKEKYPQSVANRSADRYLAEID